jgi:Helix-turn-helix of insertion element transposase
MKRTLNERQKKFVELMVDDNVYTNEQLAELCGVDVRTIYRWKRNPDITAEINKLADANLGQFIHQANRKLIDVIENGSEHAKLKAIDMLFKALGKYKEQSEITVNEGNKSIEEKKASLIARLTGK